MRLYFKKFAELWENLVYSQCNYSSTCKGHFVAFIFSLRLPYVVKKTKSLHLMKIRGSKINTAFKRGPKKFQMIICTILNNISSMKYPLKSFSGHDDVGVHHGDGNGPRTQSRCLEGSGKKLKWLISLCLIISLLWNMF